MAEITTEEKSLNPLMIGGALLALVLVVYFIFGRKRSNPEVATTTTTSMATTKDPCEDIPEWACGTVALLDPLARTGVSLVTAQAQADLEKARLRA